MELSPLATELLQLDNHNISNLTIAIFQPPYRLSGDANAIGHRSSLTP